jgi:hypothetical protein
MLILDKSISLIKKNGTIERMLASQANLMLLACLKKEPEEGVGFNRSRVYL